MGFGTLTLRKSVEFFGTRVVKLMAYGVALGFAFFLIEGAFVLVMQGFLVAVDVMPRANTMLPSWVPDSKSILIGSFVLLGLLRSMTQFRINYNFNLLPIEFARTHRARLVEIALRGTSQLKTSELLATFNDELRRVSVFTNHLCSGITSLTTLLLLLVLCLRLAPVQLLIAGSLLAIALVPIRKFGGRLKHTSREIESEAQNLMGSLITGMRNQFFIRISGMVENEIGRARAILNRYCDHERVYQRAVAINYAIPTSVGLAVIGITAFISSRYLFLSGARMISFIYLFLRIAQNASDGMVMATSVVVNFGCVKKLSALYETALRKSIPGAAEVSPGQLQSSSTAKALRIEANSVVFQYPSQSAPVLNGLSFQAGIGDLVAILGESGTGKSTLLSVIAGLLAPTSGSIRINDRDATSYGTDLWTSISYVGPDPFLIPETIRDNLLYGHPSPRRVTEAQIEEALRIAELSGLIRDLPHRLETVMTEVGNISTGQKQRLSIARAVLRNPRIYIFDESTAHLDHVTERKILENLRPLLKDRITFAATHRPAILELSTQRVSLKLPP